MRSRPIRGWWKFIWVHDVAFGEGSRHPAGMAESRPWTVGPQVPAESRRRAYGFPTERNAVPRFQWNTLNNQQVGTYTEYFVKMELTMYGFEVYSTEVDDRGIDFVARKDRGPFIEIQVKSLRTYGYVFMQKTKFELRTNVYLALGLLFESQPPRLFLVPATTWFIPNEVFVDHNYEGLKSKPEWGINISRRNMPALEQFAFDTMIEALANEVDG